MAALLADGREGFVHQNGPASVTGTIPGPQNDAPHLWSDTLRQPSGIRDMTGEAPTPGQQQGEALVVQAAGYWAVLHGFGGGYRSHVLAHGK